MTAKVEAPARIFQPTVIRLRAGYYYLMNTPWGGWASTAYEYTTLDDLLAKWAVLIGRPGRDEHGEYLEVLPDPEAK
jgi:hypothetical protein